MLEHFRTLMKFEGFEKVIEKLKFDVRVLKNLEDWKTNRTRHFEMFKVAENLF